MSIIIICSVAYFSFVKQDTISSSLINLNIEYFHPFHSKSLTIILAQHTNDCRPYSHCSPSGGRPSPGCGLSSPSRPRPGRSAKFDITVADPVLGEVRWRTEDTETSSIFFIITWPVSRPPGCTACTCRQPSWPPTTSPSRWWWTSTAGAGTATLRQT